MELSTFIIMKTGSAYCIRENQEHADSLLHVADTVLVCNCALLHVYGRMLSSQRTAALADGEVDMGGHRDGQLLGR